MEYFVNYLNRSKKICTQLFSSYLALHRNKYSTAIKIAAY